MGVAPNVAMRPLADGSIPSLACSISNYLDSNFGAFIKKCIIDQLICSTNLSLEINETSEIFRLHNCEQHTKISKTFNHGVRIYRTCPK